MTRINQSQGLKSARTDRQTTLKMKKAPVLHTAALQKMQKKAKPFVANPKAKQWRQSKTQILSQTYFLIIVKQIKR